MNDDLSEVFPEPDFAPSGTIPARINRPAPSPDHAQAREMRMLADSISLIALRTDEPKASQLYEAADRLRALAASPAEREPEAWLVEFPDGMTLFSRTRPTDYESFSSVRIVPLYRTPPAPVVTAVMLDRAMKADGFNYAMADNKELERETREFYRHILTAALRGTEG